MRQEETVPVEDRYLMLASKLSPQQIDHLDKVTVPSTVDRCRERLDSQALRVVQEYLGRGSLPSRVHLVVIAAYADLPLGKEFGILFRLEGNHEPQPVRAILRHVIFWGLPVPELVHGHHQLCVFEFSDGLPSLIESLGIEKADGRSEPELGLCSLECWQAIS